MVAVVGAEFFAFAGGAGALFVVGGVGEVFDGVGAGLAEADAAEAVGGEFGGSGGGSGAEQAAAEPDVAGLFDEVHRAVGDGVDAISRQAAGGSPEGDFFAPARAVLIDAAVISGVTIFLAGWVRGGDAVGGVVREAHSAGEAGEVAVVVVSGSGAGVEAIGGAVDQPTAGALGGQVAEAVVSVGFGPTAARLGRVDKAVEGVVLVGDFLQGLEILGAGDAAVVAAGGEIVFPAADNGGTGFDLLLPHLPGCCTSGPRSSRPS